MINIKNKIHKTCYGVPEFIKNEHLNLETFAFRKSVRFVLPW